MPDQYDREEQALYDAFERGELTQKELNKELRELERDFREDARARADEAAADAYENELNRW